LQRYNFIHDREIHRKTPEELLQELQLEEGGVKGHLKIFLGYSSGVGKSFRMLDEARRRRERGRMLSWRRFSPKVSSEVQKLLDKLEVLPLKKYSSGMAMDVARILKRRPAVLYH